MSTELSLRLALQQLVEAIENKPKKLDALIEQTKADIKALVSYVDGR